MQRILRPLVPVVAVLAATAGLAACGGGDGGGGEEASADTPVKTLLDKTFSNDAEIKSGKLDLSLKLTASGSEAGQLGGPVDMRLSGPFESQGTNKVPKFDISLSASGAGQSIKAGATSTGDKGFLSFNGQDYSVPAQVFSQFRAGYEQAAAQGSKDKKGNRSLASLGVDPRKWLTDAKNAGEGKVGDTDVVRITGGVDVARLLDDVNTLLGKAGSLGLRNQNVPNKLTEAQQKQVEEAVKDVNVEIATGADDSILRRMKVDLSAEDPQKGASSGALKLALDVQLLDLNEGQDFNEPSNTKPLADLLQQLGGAGGLGAALGGSGSGSGSSGSGSGGVSQQALEDYQKCLQEAGQDTAAAQKCAAELAP